MRRVLLVGVLACATLLLATGTAQARREQAFRYPFLRVWETAVRLLRVDFESPIGERNRDDGYFLFDFPYNGKPTPGSVEVVRTDAGEVRVVIQVPAMPSYVEQMILDKLARKLTAEYGAPVEAPRLAEPVAAKPGTKAGAADAKKPAPEKPGRKSSAR